jgi:molecular chaperone DnaJ
MYKSTFPAPLCPGSPSPDMRILVPVSTPAGIVTDIVFCFFTCPVPLHFKHGFLIEEPSPPHVGQGRSIENPCLKCSGTGQVKKQKTISVTIPAGVDTGTRIRISGEGEPGQRGAGNGDLYIFVEVQKDKLFEREDENIFCQIPISITTAILGGEVEVPTIVGKIARLSIPTGTQSETQFRLRSKGMSILQQNRQGDMYIEASVEIPVNLTNRQKSILKEFEKEGGT